MRRALGAVAVAAALLLAGCGGAGGPATTHGPTTAEPATVSVDESAVIAYDALSPAEQRFFRELRNASSETAPPPFDIRAYAPAEFGGRYDYVRYRGALYELRHEETGGLVGRQTVSAEPVNLSTNKTSTVPFGTLSAAGQETFREAIDGDESERYRSQPDLPYGAFGEDERMIITYGGQPYEVTVVNVDYAAVRYSVERLSDG
jgi:hypothetical protein